MAAEHVCPSVSEGPHEPDRTLSFLALALPPWLERRVVTIPVGDQLAAAEEWRDELVSVEAGGLEIVGPDGLVLSLEAGAVLFLDGVAHVALRATGDVPTVLAAIRRRVRRDDLRISREPGA